MRREESIVGGYLSTCEGPSGKETVNIEKYSRAQAELVSRGRQKIVLDLNLFIQQWEVIKEF